MTIREAIKIRDDNIQLIREQFLYSDDIYEADEALDAIDVIVTEIALYDMRIKTLSQERPKGRWKYIGSFSKYKCTNCKRDITIDEFDNYCPACGADMVGYEGE